MAKKVGRPKGSGTPDGPILDRVADMLIAKQAKTPNAAIMTIYRKDGMSEPSENYRRRVSRKWKAQGPERLEAARQRCNERHRGPERPARIIDRRHMGDALRAARPIDGIFADLQRPQENLRNALGPMSDLQHQIKESIYPLTTALKEMQSSGVFKVIQDIQNSGIGVQMKALQDRDIFAQLRAAENAMSSTHLAQELRRLSDQLDN